MNWISDFPLRNSGSNVGISTHIKTYDVEEEAS